MCVLADSGQVLLQPNSKPGHGRQDGQKGQEDQKVTEIAVWKQGLWQVLFSFKLILITVRHLVTKYVHQVERNEANPWLKGTIQQNLNSLIWGSSDQETGLNVEQSDPSTIGRGNTRHLQQFDQEEARKWQGTLWRAYAQYVFRMSMDDNVSALTTLPSTAWKTRIELSRPRRKILSSWNS